MSLIRSRKTPRYCVVERTSLWRMPKIEDCLPSGMDSNLRYRPIRPFFLRKEVDQHVLLCRRDSDSIFSRADKVSAGGACFGVAMDYPKNDRWRKPPAERGARSRESESSRSRVIRRLSALPYCVLTAHNSTGRSPTDDPHVPLESR